MSSPAADMVPREFVYFLEGYVEQMELHAQVEMEHSDRRTMKWRCHKTQAETCGRILKKIREFTAPAQESNRPDKELGEERFDVRPSREGGGRSSVGRHPERAEV